MKYRIEHDTLGEVRVPADKYWGAQTQRSLENFGYDQKMPVEIIKAFAVLKKACAIANHHFGLLNEEKKYLIIAVCDEIYEGKLFSHFPLSVWQTGSGTHTNMNINEVISNRAKELKGYRLEEKIEILHPNDDVNKSQSSNDTFPTAMSISGTLKVYELLKSLDNLIDIITKKSVEYNNIIKVGRTHFMDATPLSFGQEFSGYCEQLKFAKKNIEHSLNHLKELAIGGTAVGTGINAPKGFDGAVCKEINKITGIDFKPAKNKFEALASNDSFVETHGAIKQLAVSLNKIANDVRFMASGPRCGLGEITIPANEPGSSIMPGKVNPTQSEAMSMICIQVLANDAAISTAGMNGHFELNVYKPLIIKSFIESCGLLTIACRNFGEKCFSGIKINEQKVSHNLENSLMNITVLAPVIGYEKCAEIVKIAYNEDLSLKEASIKSGYISAEEFEKYFNLNDMI
jgi:fumarate hydratase class II